MQKEKRIGSVMTVYMVFSCVQLLRLCSSSVDAQSTTIRPTTAPCSRLLMKGIDNDNLPWLQMAGIYHLANFTVDLFPVYKHESINVYFYYNGSAKELRFGAPYQNASILVGAYTNGRTSSVVDSYAKPFNPFYNLITGWYQYEPVSQQYVSLSGGSQSIEPTCIADDVITCSSGMLEFDENLRQIEAYTILGTDFNILGLDYYKQLPGLYTNNRPIYTRIRGDLDTQLYLFYMDGYWFVGYDYTEARSSIYAESDTTRPEHVLGTWRFYTKGKFSPVVAKLRCRALPADKACGANPANRCLNGGTCLTSSDGMKKFCGCTPGYHGLYCEEQMPSCQEPTELINRVSIIEGSQPYYLTSLYEGSVLTIFRSLGSRPNYWFSTCDGRTWLDTSIPILQPTATPITVPTTTTTTRRYIFEWNDPVAATVIAVMVMVMQVLNPLIIWCIIRCIWIAREAKADQKNEDELQNLYRNYQTSLGVFRQNHPQPEEEYDAITSSQFSRIHEDYHRQSLEIKERKEARKNKSRGKVKLSRLFSLYAYCTFWIFVLYVILVCTTRLFGGDVFVVLCIISAVFIFVSHLIVLLEYKWSSERQYLGNLSASVFAVERIEAIRAARPHLFFRAECYHYETRTREVYYTDVKGVVRTRLETHQERIVTSLILKPVSIQYWRDTSSPELIGINNKGITKIKMTLSVEPGNEETRIEIENRYQVFKDAHGNLDEFVDFNIVKEVLGFEKRLAAYTDNRERPWWVSSAVFMAASFLFLSWPYRWAFKSITSKTQFAVSKLVYLNCPEEDNDLFPVATGNEDSNGDQLETNSTAVDMDQAPTMTTEYVNPTYYELG